MTNEFQKGALDKRIVMHLDAADIPDDLKHDSTDHADEESPGAVADTEVELAEEEKTEERRTGHFQGVRGCIECSQEIRDTWRGCIRRLGWQWRRERNWGT
jgi:hypothetical protein